MKNYILEVCADSADSALSGEEGGATRIELCQNLVIGGTTPSPKLFEEIRKYSRIPIHILIRPRFGDFFYTKRECDIMQAEVSMFRELGAEGVVIGALNADGTLDKKVLRSLIKEADGMSVTLHRAFDMTNNPYQAMEDAIELGMDTILTSGQKNRCIEGISLIKELEKRSFGRICIEAGSGINAAVIPEIYQITGVKAYHMSGKEAKESQMEYRKKEVSMGVAALDEYLIYQTDKNQILVVKKILEEL